MKTGAPQKKTTWERTSVQNLLRNRQSGHYYGRFTIARKQKWYALDTDLLSVAKLRLADKVEEVQKLRGTVTNLEARTATMGDLIEAFKLRTRANTDIKPASVIARLGAVKRLLKTWPGIEGFRHIFATTCIESGVDIPTVAGWLGHNDGGLLAMRTYGQGGRTNQERDRAKTGP